MLPVKTLGRSGIQATILGVGGYLGLLHDDDNPDHAIEAAVDDAIAAGAAQVKQYKGGNEKVLGWFVGQVMKSTQGKANPQVVNEILRKKLDG